MRMREIQNQRGSAMIELAAAGSVVAIVLGLGFYLLYLSFAKAWITRSVREAAVCLVTPESESRCRRKLESTLKAGLLVGRFDIIEFRLRGDDSIVEVTLDIEPRFFSNASRSTGRAPSRMRVSNSAPL